MGDATASSAMAFGGIIINFLFLLLFVLAIFWLIFPWMVYAQLKNLIQGQKKLEDLQSTTQQILTKMESHLEGIERSLSPATPSAPEKAYHYSSDGTQQGPLSAADLRSMRKDGLITNDTPVLREGDSKWRTYKDFLSLTR